MKLELRGPDEAVRLVHRQRPHRPHRRAGRDPLPARRERRRQVDADEHALWPAASPTRARSCIDGEPVPFALAGRRDRRRHRHGPPALHARAGLHRRRERHARPRADPRPRGARPAQGRRRSVRELSERYGSQVDPDALVEDLPVGVQQRVEILKALANEAKVLILDEPTAVLTPQETDELMEIMRSLRDAGHLDHLHHPQAARGQGDRRPDHRDPARQGGRYRAAVDLRGRARRDDGRPRGQARGRQGPGQAGRRSSSRSRT